MKKKIIMVLAIALIVSSLAACGSKADEVIEEQDTAETEVVEEPIEEATEEEPASLYEEQVIFIENGEHEIPAILVMPEVAEGETVPAVVMLHGTGSDKDEAGEGYKMLAPKLADANIASIRIDFMGSGDSTANYEDYNITTAVSDASATAKFLETVDGIDPERIGIMGWSQGGTMALHAAAADETFKSVLTWAGATDLSMLFTEEMYQEATENGFAVMEFDWRDSLNLGLQWMDEINSSDVLDSVAKINAPILAINGDKDDIVLPENAEKIIAASSNEDSKTFILENADHTFNIFTGELTEFDALCEETANWFSTTL